ncbi:hypothetical protein [Spirosoma utsteinense]
MKTKWLFPHHYRLIGWLIFVPSALLGLAAFYEEFDLFDSLGSVSPGSHMFKSDDFFASLFSNANFTDELAAVGVIAGLLFIAFSREKVEDEMIGQLQLEALQWSVYVNYLVLAIAIVAVYDGAFFNVMIYNMFTVLLVFIGWFRWLIFRSNQRIIA